MVVVREGYQQTQWPLDTGCEVSDSCLRCPLSVCKHDDPKEFNAYLERERDHRIMGLLRLYQSPQAVADVLGISIRSIERAKARVRKSVQ